MPPSVEAIKRVAARKRKAEAEARKGAEAEPEAEAGARAEIGRAQGIEKRKTEAIVGTAKVRKTERAEGKGVKKKAVCKEVRKGGAEGSRKRPRSPSPAHTPPMPKSRVDQGIPIDLTCDTPPEGPAMEGQILPSVDAQPMTVEGHLSPSLADAGAGPSAPVAGPSSTIGAGVELEEETAPPKRAPTPRVEGETSSQSLPFRSVLENHGKWAERLMSQVCTPELKRGLKERGSSSFFRDAFVAHLWTVNSLTVLKEVLSDAEVSLGNSNSEAETARARAAEMEKELDEIRAARDKDRARADNAEQALDMARADEANERARADKAEEEVRLQLDRAEKAERALEEARQTADREQKKAMDAEERFKQKEAESFSHESRLHTATIQLMGFEERVENAEEIARDANARVAEMEGTVKAAHEQVEAARKREAEAVDVFRKSAAYEEELVESTAFAYNVGFQECKAKVKRVFGLAEVDSLEPDEVEDQSDSSPAPGDATPAEP